MAGAMIDVMVGRIRLEPVTFPMVIGTLDSPRTSRLMVGSTGLEPVTSCV